MPVFENIKYEYCIYIIYTPLSHLKLPCAALPLISMTS